MGGFLSKLFEFEVNIADILNHIEDWLHWISMIIQASILQKTTSAKLIIVMEFFWTHLVY